MESVESIITIFNLLSVYYAAKNNIMTWAYGFLAASLMLFLFWTDKMYMSMMFNTYSLIMCLIGLFNWHGKEDENEEELKRTIPFINFVIFLGLSGLLLVICNCINVNYPIYDALGTSASIIGTYMLLRKDVSCWYFWILVDAIYVTYGIVSTNYEYIIIYGVMLMLAIYGLIHNNITYVKKLNYEC